MMSIKNQNICEICKCFWRTHGNKTIINCEGMELHNIPKVERLSKIYAAHNNIERVYEEDLPDSVTFLDLQFNQLKNLDSTTLKALYSSQNRSLKLSGNPWLCNCDAKLLIENFQLHKAQILDYNSLKCVEGPLINTIDISSLCATQTLIIAIISVLSLLVILLAGVYMIGLKFNREIKAFMYARGWLCCTEDDDEITKQYDVFLSFAEKDEPFVREQLLPRLEAESLVVCVHHRDWCAGDWIPAQIAKSVADSKITLIVVSSNFLRSPWAMLEFRAAHVQTLLDGTARLAVLLLEDIFDDIQLDPELKTYLATTTYVRWNEPMYWEKLMYALPQPNVSNSRNDRTMGEEVIRLVRPNDPGSQALKNCPEERSNE